MIATYLQTTYRAGARGPGEYDCWGLTRIAKFELFGGPMLPLCQSARPKDFASITTAVNAVSEAFGMKPGECKPGSVAVAWRARMCVHVGLVVVADGRMWILETDEGTGPVLTRITRFEERYTKVDYYAH